MIESGPEYEKLAADANEVMDRTSMDLSFGNAKEMLRTLQKAGLPRLDRKTALIAMLNTPSGDAFGADGGRAWAVLQP